MSIYKSKIQKRKVTRKYKKKSKLNGRESVERFDPLKEHVKSGGIGCFTKVHMQGSMYRQILFPIELRRFVVIF